MDSFSGRLDSGRYAVQAAATAAAASAERTSTTPHASQVPVAEGLRKTRWFWLDHPFGTVNVDAPWSSAGFVRCLWGCESCGKHRRG